MAKVQRPRLTFAWATVWVTIFAALAGGPAAPAAADTPVRIVALGDSLTAGFGLPGSDAFPVKLEKALQAKGIAATLSRESCQTSSS